jgi:hypothetical protein
MMEVFETLDNDNLNLSGTILKPCEKENLMKLLGNVKK